MHDVCSTADDQPVQDNNFLTFAGSQHASWQSDAKLLCHTGHHRLGMHRISHRDISSAFIDSYLPQTMKLVNSFVTSKLGNSSNFCSNLLIMSQVVTNALLLSAPSLVNSPIHVFTTHWASQGASSQSASTSWQGIIRRNRCFCIAKEQAPGCVLPADSPTRLAQLTSST